ncbi:MAG: hypothetical protein LUE12_05795 [Ruminococcus sp.]|nr:hypothetical protein [Ruminococcus sp.]
MIEFLILILLCLDFALRSSFALNSQRSKKHLSLEHSFSEAQSKIILLEAKAQELYSENRASIDILPEKYRSSCCAHKIYQILKARRTDSLNNAFDIYERENG